jgi:hypothetical protein
MYGEDYPTMTASELRFEAELDAQSAEERWEESWLDGGYSEDECPNCGEDCEGSCEDEDDAYAGGEDAFIDAVGD